MYLLIFIWFLLIFWYICTIIDPNCLNDLPDGYYDKHKYESRRLINWLYINKKADPKLPIIAHTFVLLFIMNVIATIIMVVLYMMSFDELTIKNFGIIYIVVLVLVATAPILWLNIKKK